MQIVTYARVSTLRQEDEGQSLDNQERAFQRFLKRTRWTRVTAYQEAKSAKDVTGRPEFRKMLREIEHLRPDYIVVDTIDRFTRNVEDGFRMIREISATGVKLYSIESGEAVDFADYASWREFAQNLMDAEAERRRIARRIKKSYDDRRARGVLLGNRVPFGLVRGGTRNEPRAIPDEEPLLDDGMSPAEIVREMDKRVVSGETLRDVGAWIMLTTKGCRRSIRSMGNYKHLLQHPLMVPSGLRSAQTQAQIDARLSGNAAKRQRTFDHPMTGVACCPRCIEEGVSERDALLVAGPHGNLVCRRAQITKNRLQKPSHRFSVKEAYVERRFRQALDHLTADDAALESYAESQRHSASATTERHLQSRLAKLDEQLADVEDRRNKAFRYLDTDLDDQARKMLQAVERDEAAIEAERQVLVGELAKAQSRPPRITAGTLRQRLAKVGVLWDHPQMTASLRNELARGFCAAIGAHPIVQRVAMGDYALTWEAKVPGLIAARTDDEPAYVDVLRERLRQNSRIGLAKRWGHEPERSPRKPHSLPQDTKKRTARSPR